MVFPADKETWRRVEGKDLPLGKLGDVIEDTDHNDYANFLEALQDTLGLSILSGFGSVKLRLDDMDGKIGGAGDIQSDGSVNFTGKETFEEGLVIPSNKILEMGVPNLSRIYYYAPDSVLEIKVATNILVDFYTNLSYFKQPVKISSNLDMDSYLIGGCVTISGDDYTLNDELTLSVASKGVIVRTPDNTKSYRIRVDNAGNVVTDLIV